MREFEEFGSYAAFLTQKWGQHLGPREENAPTVVSTFSGMGGSSLGYSMAGFDEKLVVEYADHAVACFRLNFPKVDVYHGDIGKLTVSEMTERIGLGVGELDLLDGSPPCQGFSALNNNRTGALDDRNFLFLEFARLIAGSQPKVFVMENVRGMIQGASKPVFKEMVKTLKMNGQYRVAVQLVDACYLQVPQVRQRVIIIGVREDLKINPIFPTPFSRPIPFKDAIANIPYPLQIGRLLTPSQARYKELVGVGRVLSAPITYAENRNAVFSHRPIHFSHRLINEDDVSRCIIKASGSIIHPDREHILSITVLKRLGSFPDEYTFPEGSESGKWQRIGNSVPPLMMYHIAKVIKENILRRNDE